MNFDKLAKIAIKKFSKELKRKKFPNKKIVIIKLYFQIFYSVSL